MHFDVKEIVSAWIAKVKPTQDQKELAESRAAICNECDQVGNITKKEVKGTRYCKVCGCILEAKVYSHREGACPLGKWNEIDRNYRNTKALKVLKDSSKSKLI